MLLVLQNVHLSPPKDEYFVLQELVGKVVKSYLPMVARSRTIVMATSESATDSESYIHSLLYSIHCMLAKLGKLCCNLATRQLEQCLALSSQPM